MRRMLGQSDLINSASYHAGGAFLFSSLCVFGSLLFALGSHFKGTPYLLLLMLIGRVFFGAGNGSLTGKLVRIYVYSLRNGNVLKTLSFFGAF